MPTRVVVLDAGFGGLEPATRPVAEFGDEGPRHADRQGAHNSQLYAEPYEVNA